VSIDTQFRENSLGLAAFQLLGLFHLQLLHCPSTWGQTERDTWGTNKQWICLTLIYHYLKKTKKSSFSLMKKWIDNSTSRKSQVLTTPAKVSSGCKSSVPLKNHEFRVVQLLKSPCQSPLSFPCPQTSRVRNSTDSGLTVHFFKLESLSTMLIMCSGGIDDSAPKNPNSAK